VLIRRLDLCLETLKPKDLETVRKWRNSESVNRNLIERSYINPQQQDLWYHSIMNEQNLYLIISYQNKKCGLIYLTHIDWDKLSFETNIFIADEAFWDSVVPVYAALIVSDLFFFHFGFQTALSKFFKSNKRSGDFDTAFGFKIMGEGSEDKDLQFLYATRESYEFSTRKLRKNLLNGGTAENMVCVDFEEGDTENPIVAKIRRQLETAGRDTYPLKSLNFQYNTSLA
jgi:RimJ/RimL family protein N-acetyltransferase